MADADAEAGAEAEAVDAVPADEVPSPATPLAAGPALLRAGFAVTARYDRIADELGVTPLQARILFILTSAPANVVGLGRELELVKSTMTGVVARMESAGLILREADPRDRRSTVLVPTERGERIADEFRLRMRDLTGSLLDPLDEAQRIQLAALLTEVLIRAEQTSPAALLPSE